MANRKYTRTPNLYDFLCWAKDNEKEANEFYEDYILPEILNLEQDDYFGTEGFDKRFA